MSQMLRIVTPSFSFVARMEEQDAPHTCARFRELLPFHQQLIHARWSGEACWIPLGDFKPVLKYENLTSYPACGQILFYVGDLSETELLFPYGSTRFASKVGQLAGNHFLTIIEGLENLPALGKLCLWEGAQSIVFEAM